MTKAINFQVVKTESCNNHMVVLTKVDGVEFDVSYMTRDSLKTDSFSAAELKYVIPILLRILVSRYFYDNPSNTWAQAKTYIESQTLRW